MTQSSESKSDEKIVAHVDAMIEELIPGFFENKKKDIKSIYDALEQDDFETIRIIGHSLKGAGGGYGFQEISNIGKSIEKSAKNKNSEEIRKRVKELSNYMDRVEVVYVEG